MTMFWLDDAMWNEPGLFGVGGEGGSGSGSQAPESGYQGPHADVGHDACACRRGSTDPVLPAGTSGSV